MLRYLLVLAACVLQTAILNMSLVAGVACDISYITTFLPEYRSHNTKYA